MEDRPLLLMSKVKAVLEVICADPALEARWLLTLAALEGIGARKITKTVAKDEPEASISEHLEEEQGHAVIFARLADQLAGSKSITPLCLPLAERWFQGVDHGIAGHLDPVQDQKACYTLTTLLIERRAMKVYPLYLQKTSQPAVREGLLQVIGEEAEHRKQHEALAKPFLERLGEKMMGLEGLERSLFLNFVNGIENEVGCGTRTHLFSGRPQNAKMTHPLPESM